MQETRLRLGWFSGSLLLCALAGCDVSVGHCDKDADSCGSSWGDGDGDGDGDGNTDAGGSEGDAGMDGGPSDDNDGGAGDASSADASHADAGDGDAGNSAAWTLGDFCDAYSRRRLDWANLLDACCSNSDRQSAQAGALLDIFGPDDGSGMCVDKYQPFLDDHSVVFHADKAAACAAAFTAQYQAVPANDVCPADGFDTNQLLAKVGHGAQVVAQLPACRAALVGQLGQDVACSDSIQCAAGRRCQTAPGGGKTCQTAVKDGGVCKANGDCIDQFTCVGSSVAGRACRAADDLVLNGGNCTFTRECAEELACSAEGSAGKCGTPAADSAICKAVN